MSPCTVTARAGPAPGPGPHGLGPQIGFVSGLRPARTGADTETVTVFLVILAFVLPTAAGYALIGFFKGLGWITQLTWRSPAPEPVDRIGADLRRLRAELEATETRTDLPGKGVRLRALRGAYLDTLTTACQRLEVSPPPAGVNVPQAEIYRAEEALRQRGLEVRSTASAH